MCDEMLQNSEVTQTTPDCLHIWQTICQN